MKRLLVIAGLLIMGMAAWPGTNRSATHLDQYGGIVALSCTNTNSGKYFSMATVDGHRLFCDPLGHPLFSRGFYDMDFTSTTVDESDKGFTSYTGTKYTQPTYTAGYEWEAEMTRLTNWDFNTIGPYGQNYAWTTRSGYPPSGGNNPIQIPFVLYYATTCSYALTNNQGYNANGQSPKMLYSVLSPNVNGMGAVESMYYGGMADPEDPNWPTYLAAWIANDGQAASILGATAEQRSYLLAVSGCDSDYSHGFTAGVDFETSPTAENNDFRYSYVTAAASPVEWVAEMTYNSSTKLPTNVVSYPDPTFYAKKAWYTQLTSEYTTISALNSAWGSNYTTFGTSGTCYGNGTNGTAWPSWLCASTSAPYSLGTGNGSTTTFSGTLNTDVSPNSVGIFVGGVLMGGDSGNAIWNGAQPNVIVGQYFNAPAIAGAGSTGGTSTWAYEVVAENTYDTSNPVVVASPVATITTGQSTISSSAPITITVSGDMAGSGNDTTGCNIYRTAAPAGYATGLIGSLGHWCSGSFTDTGAAPTSATIPPTTAGQIASGTINYTTGAITVNFVPGTAPASGTPITVEYIQNGWQYGTGLMDEDGRASHVAWMGDNAYCPDGVGSAARCTVNGTSYASAGVVKDLNAFDEKLAGDLADSFQTAVYKYFPGIPVIPWDETGQWSVPPNRYVMQGMAPYTSAIVLGGGTLPSQTMIDLVHQSMGDVAIIDAIYRTANQDSTFAYPGSTCAYSGTSSPYTVNCTLKRNPAYNYPLQFASWSKIASYCTDSTYNSPFFEPTAVNDTAGTLSYKVSAQPSTTSTTCDVAASDQGASPFYATQADRANADATDINSMVNAKFTADGVDPYAGYWIWAFTDSQSQNLSWGLVDNHDNAYNGVETTTSAVNCNSEAGNPTNTTYTCGGEYRSGWGSDDGVTPIVNANLAADAALAALGGPPPKLAGGAIHGGALH